MNVSSIVVQVAQKNFDDVLEILENAAFCDYHFSDKSKGKIIVTVEGESVGDEIKNLKIIQSIQHVIAADMMMSYSEDELNSEIEKLEKSDPVPDMLKDESLKAENIVYNGDLRKKDI
jgi:nitrate reductase NapD